MQCFAKSFAAGDFHAGGGEEKIRRRFSLLPHAIGIGTTQGQKHNCKALQNLRTDPEHSLTLEHVPVRWTHLTGKNMRWNAQPVAEMPKSSTEYELSLLTWAFRGWLAPRRSGLNAPDIIALQKPMCDALGEVA